MLLQAMTVACKVPWPVSLVVDAPSLDKYNQIWSFLLQVGSLPLQAILDACIPSLLDSASGCQSCDRFHSFALSSLPLPCSSTSLLFVICVVCRGLQVFLLLSTNRLRTEQQSDCLSNHINITSHHITSHHITSHHITLHYITLHGRPTICVVCLQLRWAKEAVRSAQRVDARNQPFNAAHPISHRLLHLADCLEQFAIFTLAEAWQALQQAMLTPGCTRNLSPSILALLSSTRSRQSRASSTYLGTVGAQIV